MRCNGRFTQTKASGHSAQLRTLEKHRIKYGLTLYQKQAWHSECGEKLSFPQARVGLKSWSLWNQKVVKKGTSAASGLCREGYKTSVNEAKSSYFGYFETLDSRGR